MSKEVTKYLEARDQNAQLRKHIQYLLSLVRCDPRNEVTLKKITEIQNYITHTQTP